MKKLFIALVRGYQRMTPEWLRGNCKYYPTCSAYAIEALQRFGALGGSLLAVWRILRCNPFSKGGVDPVPQKFLFFGRKSSADEGQKSC